MGDATFNRENLIAWYRGQAEEAHLKLLALQTMMETTRDPEETAQLSREMEAWQERFCDSIDEITRLKNAA